jgi:hypothetical protein
MMINFTYVNFHLLLCVVWIYIRRACAPKVYRFSDGNQPPNLNGTFRRLMHDTGLLRTSMCRTEPCIRCGTPTPHLNSCVGALAYTHSASRWVTQRQWLSDTTVNSRRRWRVTGWLDVPWWLAVGFTQQIAELTCRFVRACICLWQSEV